MLIVLIFSISSLEYLIMLNVQIFVSKQEIRLRYHYPLFLSMLQNWHENWCSNLVQDHWVCLCLQFLLIFLQSLLEFRLMNNIFLLQIQFVSFGHFHPITKDFSDEKKIVCHAYVPEEGILLQYCEFAQLLLCSEMSLVWQSMKRLNSYSL